MGAREVGRDPALGRAVDEAEPEQERLVHVLDRLDLLGQDGRQRGDPDRAGGELLDDRREELAIGRVEALVVDLHGPHRGGRGRLVDVTVAVDLGVIAGALEQPVDDPGRAPAAPGDRPDGRVVDADGEDDRRALDDRGELLVRVEIEPVGGAEPVAQRAADPARPRRGADHRERLEAEAERPGRRALADHDVERVVLHRRVEDLLDRAVEPMDLVDEQDVALLERGQDRGQVAGALDGRARRVFDVDAQLARDDRGQGRLAQAGRPVQEDVVGGLSPAPCRLEQDRQVRLDLALADVFVERARPEGALDDEVTVVLEVRREDAREVVGHRLRV